jgi:hypothetical protein
VTFVLFASAAAVQVAAGCVDGVTPDCSIPDAQCNPVISEAGPVIDAAAEAATSSDAEPPDSGNGDANTADTGPGDASDGG